MKVGQSIWLKTLQREAKLTFLCLILAPVRDGLLLP